MTIKSIVAKLIIISSALIAITCIAFLFIWAGNKGEISFYSIGTTISGALNNKTVKAGSKFGLNFDIYVSQGCYLDNVEIAIQIPPQINYMASINNNNISFDSKDGKLIATTTANYGEAKHIEASFITNTDSTEWSSPIEIYSKVILRINRPKDQRVECYDKKAIWRDKQFVDSPWEECNDNIRP